MTLGPPQTPTSTAAAPAGSTLAPTEQAAHGPLAPLALALGATAVIAFIAPLSDLLVRAADVLAGAP